MPRRELRNQTPASERDRGALGSSDARADPAAYQQLVECMHEGAAIVSDLGGLRLMVVDRDEDAREIVAEMLRRGGAQVSDAASAGEAIEELLRLPPDVLVSDIAMPGVDGYGLMRQVRAPPPELGRRIPAVALTAYAGPEHAARALDAGFQEHLAKPCDPVLLVRLVASLGGETGAR